MKKVKLGKMIMQREERKTIKIKGMKEDHSTVWQEVDFGDFCDWLLQPKIQKVF